jgi:hypothetical protein
MKKKILSILLIGIIVIGITGCSSNSSSTKSTVEDELNELMDKLEQESDDFHVSTIQDYLENNSNYRLIAGAAEEFTEKPSSSNQQYTVVQKREQLINTNSDYVLIYNVETDKYYSIPLGAVGYKPYFNDAIEIN